ncbi:MAG TPA: peroxiredoxin [Candidatus Thermoplasmatota archaeon]|nr:peroxiredoxin [Candidatus Thermoplasmatota archaeon]
MALEIGAIAPDFRLPGSDGKEHSPASLRGRPYVLTFYPKDETAGCVAQVCALRDVWEDFRHMDVAVFGVSRDSVEDHQAFVANRKLPYSLLTDASGAMHKAFDVGRTFGVTNRVSYLVDAAGTIRAAYASNLRPEQHAARMLAAAKALAR